MPKTITPEQKQPSQSPIIFPDNSNKEEAKRVEFMAGKMLAKARKTKDAKVAKKMVDAARMMLMAAKILKGI